MSDAQEPSVVQPQRRTLRLYGRAVVYGPWSQPVDGKRFRIAKGSFVPDVPVTAYYSHDRQTLIGSTENGTIVFKETDLGLNVTIDAPRTSEGRKAYQLVRDGYLTSMSFGMQVIEARKVGHTAGVDDYEVTKFKLTEVSPTPKASFPGTSISTVDEIIDGRDQIVRDAQRAIVDDDLRRRVTARQYQQATARRRS